MTGLVVNNFASFKTSPINKMALSDSTALIPRQTSKFHRRASFFAFALCAWTFFSRNHGKFTVSKRSLVAKFVRLTLTWISGI